tara:strand:+ start:198 stop:335 length:138 start_codon:yes stop_codon:yes gene_type:complete
MVAHQLRRPERAREAKRQDRVQVLAVFVSVVSETFEDADQVGVLH